MGKDNLTQNIQQPDQLHFMLCGSVDDGKSTLLGRLLYECQAVLSDQMQATKQESSKYGTQNGALDMALLIDGLQAEREQGITIDVAYRYFATDKRKFIATDTPGHIEYTRNMANAASTAELAIILVDASQGLLEQTFRHSYICALMGVKHIVLAVNKMDKVDYAEAVFSDIVTQYQEFLQKLAVLMQPQADADAIIETSITISPKIAPPTFTAIPISALQGKNITENDRQGLGWYQGDNLLKLLENIEIAVDERQEFILPVQWVNRPNEQFRGFAGQIIAGTIKQGDKIVIHPSMQTSSVTQILSPRSANAQGDVTQAMTGEAITLVIADKIDISRGSFICSDDARLYHSDQFSAHFIVMDEQPIHAGRSYLLRTRNQLVDVQITNIRYQIDVNHLEHLASKSLQMNHIAVCQFKTDKPILFTQYQQHQQAGSFLLIDKISDATLGAGMIDFSLRRGDNIVWHDMKIDKLVRSQQKQQKPCILWFTGLSGSGKSTIADKVEQKLQKMNHHTYLLDGDNVRHGLNQDLGFTDEDRIENIRRVAQVSKLMVDAGLITLVSFISPFASERELARDLLEAGEFIEIYIATPLALCEERDPKGLYHKARAGQLKNFTGIDSPYEVPKNPEITLDTAQQSADILADQVIAWLQQQGYLNVS